MFTRVLHEPPFRLLAKCLARYCSRSLASKVRWEAAERPQYALGVLFAANQARRLGIPEIVVIEFGVASGKGLLVLAAHAARAEREIGTRIQVYGFDLGTGLPASSDFRDHPDNWKGGDFPMAGNLQSRIGANTRLVLGNVAVTVSQFVARQTVPVGFAAFDLDLYSSTRAALELFTLPDAKMLPHTAIYFDDTQQSFNHRFAGELLAIDEFNRESASVKIDRWRGIRVLTAFPDSPWLEAMYMAHQLVVAPSVRREALRL